MEGFLRYRLRGLIFGGAHIWRGLFSEFYGILFSNLTINLLIIFVSFLLSVFLLYLKIYVHVMCVRRKKIQ